MLRSRRTGEAVGSLCWVGAQVVALLNAGAAVNGAPSAGDDAMGEVVLIVRDTVVATFPAAAFF